MNEPDVLCLGELVWDCYETGAFLGGAPFNVAVQLARHGVGAALLTAVGRDDLGRWAQAFLQEERIPGVRVHPRLPTGTVTVALDAAGLPRFAIQGACAWTDLGGAAKAAAGPVRPSVLVFGGLAMHSEGNRHLLMRLLERWSADHRGSPIVLCDLNLRPGWSDPEVARWCLGRSHFLRVNEEEARFLAVLEGQEGPAGILARHGLRGICTGLGPDGLVWHGPEGAGFRLPVWG